MRSNDHEYHFNLFKPTTEHGRRNRNIILTMLLIWFVAVFGFQLLLVIFQKPTPEKAYIVFGTVWEDVKAGTAGEAKKQEFVKSLLSVYGKLSVKKEDRDVLRNAVSSVVFGMISDSEQVLLAGHLERLQSARENLTKADQEEYTMLQATIAETRNEINTIVNSPAGIAPASLESSLIPYCLNQQGSELTQSDQERLPALMHLYLVHNQSFLTDFKFLGFPFHYFYTGELLLILFVLLCLLYFYRIEALDKKYLTTVH